MPISTTWPSAAQSRRYGWTTLFARPSRGSPSIPTGDGRGDEGTRELVLVGLPYVVVYTVGETRITVLRVLHTAQRWPH